MTLNTTDLVTRLKDHALGQGLFDRVNEFEALNPPGSGLACAIWVDRINPHAVSSGLNATSAVLVAMVRLYYPMSTMSPDLVDPTLAGGADALIRAYSGDFELGGAVRQVDLLGTTGTALSAQAGYIRLDDAMYRVYTITVPLVMNDLWDQAP